MINNLQTPPCPAIVAKTSHARELELYLLRTERGVRWTDDEASATRFSSMHDAILTAARLPAGLKAYGLPCSQLRPQASQLH